METAAQSGVQRRYHYEGFNPEYLRDTLTNQRVHLSNPQNFNDLWDCNPYFQIDLEDPESRRKWGERLYGYVPVSVRAQLETKGKWYEEKEFLSTVKSFVTSMAQQSSGWRIYCLAKRPGSALMWAHYAQKLQGICLEFDAGHQQVGLAYPVRYQNSFPLIELDALGDPRRLINEMLLTKSREWAYEEEYRLLCRDDFNPAFPLRMADNYLPLRPGALTGIIAGVRADVAANKEVMTQSGCDIPLRRAVQVPNQYRLGDRRMTASGMRNSVRRFALATHRERVDSLRGVI